MSEEKHVVEHEQQKKEKTKKQYKPFWIVVSFIILIVVLLLPAPSSLPIMAKAVLAILAFCSYYVGNGSCIISGVSNFNYWLNDITLGFSPVQKFRGEAR